MPGQGKYTQYEPLKVDKASKGSSSSTRLQKLFNTPARVNVTTEIHKNANAFLLAVGNKGVQIGDPNQFKSGVSLDYAGAPDLNDVATGGKGLPSTPYTPNLTSPGEASGVSPNGQVDMEIKAISDLNGQAQADAGGLKNPSKESSTMGTTVTITADSNPWVPGGHPGGEGLKLNEAKK